MQQGAFSDLEDLLDASHKLVEESVDSRARSQQASPAVTRDTLRQVSCLSHAYFNQAWAARYDTGLLIKLTPEGIV